MSRGKSGRIVIEVDPALKRELYLALEYDQKTLKEWFTFHVQQFLSDQAQPSLFVSDPTGSYDLTKKRPKTNEDI
jgi:hypothetical protein